MVKTEKVNPFKNNPIEKTSVLRDGRVKKRKSLKERIVDWVDEIMPPRFD